MEENSKNSGVTDVLTPYKLLTRMTDYAIYKPGFIGVDGELATLSVIRTPGVAFSETAAGSS